MALQLDGVRRVFDNNRVVIAGMDLHIASGEFLAVLGPSGCGKSTLLRMIARLAEPDSGHIRMDPNGEPFQTAFVFQDAHLLPWRNVLANAALPLELMGEPKPERENKAHAVLEQVGLQDALDRYPAQLSGGMRMRVSLARALVTEPRLNGGAIKLDRTLELPAVRSNALRADPRLGQETHLLLGAIEE